MTPAVKSTPGASNLGVAHACLIQKWQRPCNAWRSSGTWTLVQPTPNHRDAVHTLLGSPPECFYLTNSPLSPSKPETPGSKAVSYDHHSSYLSFLFLCLPTRQMAWASGGCLQIHASPRVHKPLHHVTFCFMLPFHLEHNSPLLPPQQPSPS